MNNIKKSIFKTQVIEEIPPTFSTWRFSSPGRTSASLACAETTYPNNWYTTFQTGSVPALGSTMYLNSTLTTAVGGGNFWFKSFESVADEPTSYQVDNSGVLVAFSNC